MLLWASQWTLCRYGTLFNMPLIIYCLDINHLGSDGLRPHLGLCKSKSAIIMFENCYDFEWENMLWEFLFLVVATKNIHQTKRRILHLLIHVTSASFRMRSVPGDIRLWSINKSNGNKAPDSAVVQLLPTRRYFCQSWSMWGWIFTYAKYSINEILKKKESFRHYT